jgi:hypothetical protein
MVRDKKLSEKEAKKQIKRLKSKKEQEIRRFKSREKKLNDKIMLLEEDVGTKKKKLFFANLYNHLSHTCDLVVVNEKKPTTTNNTSFNHLDCDVMFRIAHLARSVNDIIGLFLINKRNVSYISMPEFPKMIETRFDIEYHRLDEFRDMTKFDNVPKNITMLRLLEDHYAKESAHLKHSYKSPRIHKLCLIKPSNDKLVQLTDFITEKAISKGCFVITPSKDIIDKISYVTKLSYEELRYCKFELANQRSKLEDCYILTKNQKLFTLETYLKWKCGFRCVVTITDINGLDLNIASLNRVGEFKDAPHHEWGFFHPIDSRNDDEKEEEEDHYDRFARVNYLY